MSELNPCPFCLTDDQSMLSATTVGFRQYHVLCGNCLAGGPANREPDKARMEWNERLTDDR
jgi:hypothetical protein